jgi:hypothetical protein
MREGPPGDKVLYFDKAGKPMGSEPYNQWMGPKLKQGETVQCTCTEDAVHLYCPIHAVETGEDFDPL